MSYLRWSIVVVLASAPVGCVVPVTSGHRTCVICRAYRADKTYAGVPWSRQYETECSRWYAAHVEQKHAHVWERGTCTYFGSLLGGPRGVGCSPGRYPIHLLPSETQMRAYQHFKNPFDAKALFSNLTDAKTHNDRLDEHDFDRGHLTVDSIKAWEAAGFPGTWDEWWGRWYTKHVEEHKEYVAWLNADSGLHFDDWRKQRR